MPIYEYICSNCRHEFEQYSSIFVPSLAYCPYCHSMMVKRLPSSPLIKTGGRSKSSSDFNAKDAEIKYFKDKKAYKEAARAAEKAGKSEWEVKDLYRKAERKN